MVQWAAKLFKQIAVKCAALSALGQITKEEKKSVCHQSRVGEFADMYLLDTENFLREVFLAAEFSY